MRRLIGLAVLGVAILAAILLVRAVRLPSRQIAVEPAPPLELDARAAGERLGAAVRFETISHQEPERFPADAFRAFQAWLAGTYPRLHRSLELTRVSEFSLLYRWRGRDPELAPAILLAHQDVVPIADESKWSHPPFSGALAEGFVWGRGSMDDKGSLVAICEAVELLLARGFAPDRTFLLGFGHDEELGGPQGAVAIAKLLESRGVRGAFVLDEGMALVEGVIPGVARTVALVGVAEKGYATIVLSVEEPGGHSSVPPRQTAVGILASAIHRLERNPLPGGIDGVSARLFEYLAPELPMPLRLPLANLWLFGGLLERMLSDQPVANALLRTTTAATMFEGSPKENVLPSRASARVNFRIRPGDESEEVLAFVRQVIDDPRVELEFARLPREPSPVSATDGPVFALLQRTIGEVYPDALVAPGLVLGGTDARHYAGVSEAVYRFMPFVFGQSDLPRGHGIDERLSLETFGQGIRFYARLIENAAGALPGA